jgi:hypothetical protein
VAAGGPWQRQNIRIQPDGKEAAGRAAEAGEEGEGRLHCPQLLEVQLNALSFSVSLGGLKGLGGVFHKTEMGYRWCG